MDLVWTSTLSTQIMSDVVPLVYEYVSIGTIKIILLQSFLIMFQILNQPTKTSLRFLPFKVTPDSRQTLKILIELFRIDISSRLISFRC